MGFFMGNTLTKNADMSALVSARYRGDIDLLKAIHNDSVLVEEQKKAGILRKQSRTRMGLLANAVRVSPELLPAVAASVAHIQSRVDVGKPLEAYVYAEGDVNAFVTEGHSRFLVGLSSGAVQTLATEELEFVIGHELGHALFAHTEVAAGFLVENGRVSEANSKLLRSWQRAAEISADRVGLLCCADLEVATTALVKTLAGLPLGGARFKPSDITSQWESLLEELMDEGANDLWEHSHPFPPLRIKAIEAFWSAFQAGTDANGDIETRRFLSMMDVPGHGCAASETSGDGLLGRFLLWGCLYVGLADGPLSIEGKARLDALTVPGADLENLLVRDPDPSALALEHFRTAKTSRRSKLRADELTSIMKQLISFAGLDAQFTDLERARLVTLAKELGLPERAVELLIEQHQKGA